MPRQRYSAAVLQGRAMMSEEQFMETSHESKLRTRLGSFGAWTANTIESQLTRAA
jgi:hypothetical protein